MLKKRLIFTLLYDQGYFMLSRNFGLQRVGNIDWLNKNYNFSRIAFSIDELVILDVTRGEKDPEQFCNHIKLLTNECFVPITAGGGVKDVEYARLLLKSGADKVSVNTLIYEDLSKVEEIAKEFGNQVIVASIDIKKEEEYFVYVSNSAVKIDTKPEDWLKKVSSLSIGEIYLNSINQDGTGQGFALDLLDFLPKNCSVPVILSGGAGHCDHLMEGLKDPRVDAVSTAHLFNFIGDGLLNSRNTIKNNFDLAAWDQPDFPNT